MSDLRHAKRLAPDQFLTDIADYVLDFEMQNQLEAMENSRYCLMDSLGCALMALSHPACKQRLGPIVPEAEMRLGARVPGTSYVLDPVQAAFNIGAMIRWLDFNDTWLAAEWGHPSDNFGGILAVADYLDRHADSAAQQLTMHDVLTAAVKAYEIQGIIALDNAFNQRGFDHVLLVRLATTAVATALVGGDREMIINALSNALLDGAALRTYRHAPNTGVRKSWAAGDATSRGVWHALQACRGEMGYPTALSAPRWGFEHVVLQEKLQLSRSYGSYVMENILFKIAFPAEFHAQTAVEAAIRLHPLWRDRRDEVQQIRIETQQSAIRIIDKTGPLDNPADRDHCLQYMVAIALMNGALEARDYDDKAAKNPLIDALRNRMEVVENTAFSRDYLDPDKRSIANSVQLFFADGSHSERIQIDYPIGHRRRRKEGIPLLQSKFDAALTGWLPAHKGAQIAALSADPERLYPCRVQHFLDLFVI